MKRIALKIDADTYHGTLTGVPALIDLLQRHETQGTFFFSFGRDQSGRNAGQKSLKRYYNLSTRLYGRLLPGPDIGKRCAESFHLTRNAGFEVGIHAWNRTRWEQQIHQADNPWVEAEMNKACARFSETFAEQPKAHAAAGWKMNRHALRLTQRLKFDYASDCRGTHPFIPVIDGEIVACPQLPTSLPTLDEVLAQETGFSADQAMDRILELSDAIPGDHIFNLRAELEGMKFTSSFERLLAGWKARGDQIVGLGEIYASLNLKELPLHAVNFLAVPGYSGLQMTQGPVFL